jgi:multidrug efflux system membrane fusion protein
MEDRLFEAHRGTRVRATLRSLLIGILGLLFLMLFSSACSDEKSKKPVSAPIPVTVSIAIRKTVPVELRAIGNVQAYSTVTVKSKVGGELVGVHFKEGQDVKKGSSTIL